jgi:hypothetical protein
MNPFHPAPRGREGPIPVASFSLCRLQSLVMLIVVIAGIAAGPGLSATVLPAFDPAQFVPGAAITNPYFPVTPGTRSVLVAEGTDETGQPFTERGVLTPGSIGPTIAGVATSTMTDLAYEDGVLVERTLDYFAQDVAGNVWYMGEDVINYVYDEDGNLTGTNSDSTWRAGVNGAQPGYQMLATLTPGYSYFQEFAEADGALDQAMILGFLDVLTVPGGTFRDVLMVFESSTLDPALREVKYYAPGVGLIRADEGVDAQYQNPKLILSLVSVAAIPVPAALPLMAGALAMLGLIQRRRRGR